jgi:hypothetical protein
VNRRGTSVASVGVGVLIGLPLAAIASPIIAVVTLFIILATLVQLEGPVDTSIQYVVTKTSAGRCVAEYDSSAPAGKRARLGSWSKEQPGETADGATAKPFDATWLKGKRVTCPEFEPGPRQVLRVFSPPLIKANYVRVRADGDGTEATIEIMNGLCLVE